MTTAPVSAPYPRDRQARLNVIRSNEEWVRSRIWKLEDATARALLDQFVTARERMNAALIDVWNRYGAGDTWSTRDANFRVRTDALMQQITRSIDDLIKTSQDEALAAAERSYRAGYYGRAWVLDQGLRGGSDVSIPLLPDAAIRAAILNPYGGNTFIDRYSGARDEFVALIRRSIVGSQIDGDSINAAMKRLAAALGLNITRGGADRGLRYRLEMIARTEILRASNMGALAIYDANSDVLQGWEFIATNDDRTCEECGAADGKQYAFDDESDKPPLHPNCRCSVLPVLINSELSNRIAGQRQTYGDWANQSGVGNDGGVFD